MSKWWCNFFCYCIMMATAVILKLKIFFHVENNNNKNLNKICIFQYYFRINQLDLKMRNHKTTTILLVKKKWTRKFVVKIMNARRYRYFCLFKNGPILFTQKREKIRLLLPSFIMIVNDFFLLFCFIWKKLVKIWMKKLLGWWRWTMARIKRG